MEPLKITAYLSDGRVAGSDCNFPLDSILQYQWFAINKPDLIYAATPPDENLEHAPLPFERREIDGKWYWACSFNMEKPKGETVKFWHKRFDTILAEEHVDFGKRRGKVNLTSGKYKAYRMPLIVFLFDKLSWYAFGDLEGIKELCVTVTSIGKKKSQGFGFIESWDFEKMEKDFSEKDDRGNLTRPLPFSVKNFRDGGKIMQCGVRPPYWHRESQEVCYVP